MKKYASSLLFALLAATLVLTGCSKEDLPIEPAAPPTKEEVLENNALIDESTIDLVQFKEPQSGDLVVTMETTMGDLHFVLFKDLAPIATEKFIASVTRGVYDDVPLSKVMNNFVVECQGNPVPEVVGVSADQSKNTAIIGAETSLNLWNFRGALATREPLADDPHSALSSIYIVQAMTINDVVFQQMEDSGYPQIVIDRYKEVGGIPGYDTHYTIFGQIYNGLESLDEMANIAVDESYKPVEEVRIIRSKVSTYNEQDPMVLPDLTPATV